MICALLPTGQTQYSAAPTRRFARCWARNRITVC